MYEANSLKSEEEIKDGRIAAGQKDIKFGYFFDGSYGLEVGH